MKLAIRKKTALFFLVTFCIALALFSAFWLAPLAQLGSITVDSQESGLFTDANFYLHWAKENCESANENRYYVTWSSAGVVFYLTAACNLLGGYLAFVFLNAVLFSATFVAYILSIEKHVKAPRFAILSILVLLIPYTLVQIISPGKEIFAVIGHLLIGRIILDSSPRFWSKNVAFAIAMFGVSRIHQAVLAFAVYVGVRLRKRTSPAIFVLLSLLSLIAADFLAVTFLEYSYRDLLFAGHEESNGLQRKIGELVISDNIVLHLLLTPVRVAALIFGPLYTSLAGLYSGENTGAYWVFRELQLSLRIFDTLIIIFGLYLSLFRLPQFKSIGLYVILSLVAISFFGVAEKNRYLYELSPLLLPVLALSFRTERTRLNEQSSSSTLTTVALTQRSGSR